MKMADSKTQPGVEVSEQLWKQFRQDVTKRRGTVHGNLSHELESAIREYLNASKGGDLHDRLNRIENRLEDIAASGGGGENANGSDEGTDSVSNTTANRIDEIMADVRARADQLDTNRVRESDVEAAIERHAGATYKTIRRYKKLLQNQRELFADPEADDVYYTKPSAFIARVENAVPQNKAIEIRETYGDEWWLDHAPDGMFEQSVTGPSFQ